MLYVLLCLYGALLLFFKPLFLLVKRRLIRPSTAPAALRSPSMWGGVFLSEVRGVILLLAVAPWFVHFSEDVLVRYRFTLFIVALWLGLMAMFSYTPLGRILLGFRLFWQAC
jgi:hypothetical protein